MRTEENNAQTKNKTLISCIIRCIISCGGTGGHIYPAIAVADELKKQSQNVSILFIGARGKMEEKIVPQNGFRIETLSIRGLQRSFSLSNLLLPFRVLDSLWKTYLLFRKEKPDFVIGFGGYASFPTLVIALLRGVPYFLQEQNQYAGLTNRMLARWAKAIFVAYPNMEKTLVNKRIIYTGNPLRNNIVTQYTKTSKTLLILGGSLGAKQINDSILVGLDKLLENGFSVIWQTGMRYYDELSEKVKHPVKHPIKYPSVKLHAFIKNMGEVYGQASLIVARSGALTVSELALIGKPTIYVPSPNVVANHQYHNAMYFVEQGAARCVLDKDVPEKLINTILELSQREDEMQKMGEQMRRLAKPLASQEIVQYICKSLC